LFRKQINSPDMMLKKNVGELLVCIICVVSTIAFSGCIQTKSITYFNNLPDSISRTLKQLEAPNLVLQANDMMEIQIGGENDKTVQYINQYFGSGASGISTIVDIDGNIQLPKIGKLHVGGLTREAARDTITSAYKEYLLNPIVSVKFGDFKFAILGEIKSPGYFTSTKEKLNIFEAIAMGGDMTQYAKRDQVRIIRDDNGKRSILSLNFLDSSILNSPNFFLHNYDIVYIEPTSIKLRSENFQRNFMILTSVVSVMSLLLVLIKK